MNLLLENFKEYKYYYEKKITENNLSKDEKEFCEKAIEFIEKIEQLSKSIR